MRDRAILALGLASALQRSELVALQMLDVQLVKEGARLTIRSSKTDQEWEERVIAVTNGQTIQPVARLVPKYAALAGIDRHRWGRIRCGPGS